MAGKKPREKKVHNPLDYACIKWAGDRRGSRSSANACPICNPDKKGF